MISQAATDATPGTIKITTEKSVILILNRMNCQVWRAYPNRVSLATTATNIDQTTQYGQSLISHVSNFIF